MAIFGSKLAETFQNRIKYLKFDFHRLYCDWNHFIILTSRFEWKKSKNEKNREMMSINKFIHRICETESVFIVNTKKWWIHNESTKKIVDSCRIHEKNQYVTNKVNMKSLWSNCKVTLNLPSILGIHYEFTYCSAKSLYLTFFFANLICINYLCLFLLWINYLNLKFTVYIVREFDSNQLSLSWIHSD